MSQLYPQLWLSALYGFHCPSRPSVFSLHLVELAAPVPDVIHGVFSDQRQHVRPQAAPDQMLESTRTSLGEILTPSYPLLISLPALPSEKSPLFTTSSTHLVGQLSYSWR